MSAQGGTRAIVAALAANLGIALTKLLAFLLSGSSSMLAESVHSLADSGNQGLLLLGGRRARRGATAEHPFGFGRERYLYGFVVSIVLFSVGGLFALYEAFHKWQEAQAGHGAITSWQWVPVAVLAAAMTMEGLSFRTAIAESNQDRGRRSWVEFIRSAKAPELPVILLEDFAALVGLAFALVGVVLTLLTGDGRWDAGGTGLIGMLLVAVAGVLAVETKSLLLGESASPQAVAAIVRSIESVSGVERVIHQRTVHIGPEEVLVAVKFAVARGLRAEQIAEAIDAAETRARGALPDLTLLMYLEPDIDVGQTSSASVADAGAVAG